MTAIANIEDLRRLAYKRLPRVLFDYIDGGAQNEVTLRANQEDFSRWTIVQHVLRDVSKRDQSVTWRDIEWAKSIWGGPLALKGILEPGDAKAAIEHGADALIVSNHGGRQLDGVRSAISALPGVVDAVAGRADVLLDGGVRRGTDVFKAVALGAKACMIGRPYMYGLASKGRAGVVQALELLRNEIDLALALSGNTKISALDRSSILASFPGEASSRS